MRFSVVGLLAFLCLIGSGSTASAEEGKVHAMAVLQGEATTVQAGESESLLVGMLEGVMFVANNKGPLHMAKMACPLYSIIGADLNQTVSGRCLLADVDGNQIYASISCKGSHMEGCSGEFKLIGGSGKYKGITGSSSFVFRSTTTDMAPGEIGVMTRKVVGLGVWPELTYRIP